MRGWSTLENQSTKQGDEKMPHTYAPHVGPIAYTIAVAVDPPGLVPAGGSVGNFVYQPALLHVSAGDTITWTCNDQFTLVFKEGSPIGELEVFGSPIPGGYSAGPFTVESVQGNFHYAISVWNSASSQLFLDAACPRISVN
jgi:plastocyanin